MNLEQMIQRQQQLLDAARAANRELTAEEQLEYDSLQREIDRINAIAPAAPADNGSATAGDNSEREAAVTAAREAERSRIREIEAMCKHFGVESRSYIGHGRRTIFADKKSNFFGISLRMNTSWHSVTLFRCHNEPKGGVSNGGKIND